jgi:hypothetical protein
MPGPTSREPSRRGVRSVRGHERAGPRASARQLADDVPLSVDRDFLEAEDLELALEPARARALVAGRSRNGRDRLLPGEHPRLVALRRPERRRDGSAARQTSHGRVQLLHPGVPAHRGAHGRGGEEVQQDEAAEEPGARGHRGDRTRRTAKGRGAREVASI